MSVGNAQSAARRISDFIDRVRTYVGREPSVVVVFAEDYDAIKGKEPPALKPYRIERGPSVEEYR